MNPGPRTPDLGPLIIGHRGFAASFPDNSMDGVEAAIAAGADGVEVDIRPCRDGTWVCHHDRSRSGHPIAGWPLDSLRREGVPTLAEVVSAVPADRWLFVEIKPLATAQLRAGLAALGALLGPRLGSTRVISSAERLLALVKGALPGVSRSLVFDRVPGSLPDGVELSPFHRLVESLTGSGRPLHPWTVDLPARMRELAALGVASITTNEPVVALEVLHD
ncbi:MAG: glycerophosphodiester phosphodiesterase [Acidobacteriia bacterium]|nr:glycerophosphodiester phosphodiesterase [Terriglobia bacterium]